MPDPVEEAMATIDRAIALVRTANKANPSRAKALALTRCEEAKHWLLADAFAVHSPIRTLEENAR